MNTIPTVTKNLLIINVLMFLGTIVAQSYGIDLNNYLGLHFFPCRRFQCSTVDYLYVHARRIYPSVLQHVCCLDVRPYTRAGLGGRNASCSTTSHAASVQGLSRSLYNTSITKRYFPHTTVSIPGIPSSPWKNIST